MPRQLDFLLSPPVNILCQQFLGTVDAQLAAVQGDVVIAAVATFPDTETVMVPSAARVFLMDLFGGITL